LGDIGLKNDLTCTGSVTIGADLHGDLSISEYAAGDIAIGDDLIGDIYITSEPRDLSRAEARAG
jgi:hypothetical protein